MLDLSNLGRAGLIIQYEDVISLMGYNIAEYLRANKVNDQFERMSHEDILLSYINREHYDINKWLKETFDYDLNIYQLMSSRIMLQPNFIYAYKIFQESAKQGITNLIVYSNHPSDAIVEYLSSFEVAALKHESENIVELLNHNPNCTFITSNPDAIQLCEEVRAPFVLTIVDDFLYVKDILLTRADEKLRKQDKLVYFTSVLSGGLTNVIRD
jgi:hypothetical protein